MDEFYDYPITTDFLINTTMHKIVHYNEGNSSYYYMVGNNPVLTVS